MIAFFSLWEIRFLMVRVCVYVCVGFLLACACAVWVCVGAYVCVPLLWIISVYALHVCVLYERLGSFWHLSPPGVFLLLYICVCARACVVTLAQVVRLHDSRYSYGVLTCADAWPVWEREAAGVRVFAVKRSTSTVRVSDARSLRQEMFAQCTRCTFPVVDIWYFLVSVYDFFWVYTFVTFFFHAVYLLLYRKAHLCFVFLIIFLCWSFAWKLNRLSSCQKFSKQQNVVVVVVEGLDFCFLLFLFFFSVFLFVFFPENIKHTSLSVKVVGCMNGKQKLFSEVLTVQL